MPHSTETMTIDGAKIRVLRGGPEGAGAQPLVFLHGAGGHTGWMAFLEELSQRFAVYAPEHPGFGQSDDPSWLDGVGDLAYFYLDFPEDARSRAGASGGHFARRLDRRRDGGA